MKKLLFLFITFVFFACEQEEVVPQVVETLNPTEDTTFNLSDYTHSLWVLKGYYKDGAYITTFSDKCGCPQTIGFVLNFEQDTIPFDKGKYHTYYRSLIDDSDNQGSAQWMPIDSLFNDWPTGNSDYFQEYRIISANEDSLVIEDGTPNTADGSYAVYVNESDWLIYE